MRNTIVCKFGGSSLANAEQFRKVKAIVESDERRRIVVCSAPGKRGENDAKITDLFYLCRQTAEQNLPFQEILRIIHYRYDEIREDLGLKLDLKAEFQEIEERLKNGASADYAASRGEYLTAKLLAEYLGYEFVDAKDFIVISRSNGGTRVKDTNARLVERFKDVDRAVIPGFYGVNVNGEIMTYSRGGSDVTGAVLAQGLGAELYENWTDVDGFRMVDPRLVPDAMKIECITYGEMRELAYMGAKVLHEEAMIPCMRADIPIHIKNTNHPDEPGTRIVEPSKSTHNHDITGITGKKGFVAINIEKLLMNQQKGFIARVVSIFERHGISIEMVPSGIDNITIIVETGQIESKLHRIMKEIQSSIHPDKLVAYSNMAILAVVGEGMVGNIGVGKKIFSALADANLNVRMISQGVSEISVFIGIDEDQLERGVLSIYEAFR